MTPTADNSTICAISTPTGVGGIAVARISGPDAIMITDSIWQGKSLTSTPSGRARVGYIVDPADHTTLDQAVATIYRNPHSFTGEDTVELAVHGSRYVQRELLQLLITRGCRMAQAGEFTRRAFANGKIDLAEAEAVADVIASDSRISHRIAMSQLRGQYSARLSQLRDKMLELAALLELELDFSEEDVTFADRTNLLSLAREASEAIARMRQSFKTGQTLNEGIPTVIIGAPNAGKSTLLNALLNDERAIVSDIPGTTRDSIEAHLDIDGLRFRIIDTAGLHATTDKVELIGIDRAWQKIAQAQIIVLVADSTRHHQELPHLLSSLHGKFPENAKIIIALNKTDLNSNLDLPDYPEAHDIIKISALTGDGLDTLRCAMKNTAGIEQWEASEIVTNTRHYEALNQAHAAMERTIQSINDSIPTDLVTQDLREAIHHLNAITGNAITTTSILQTIFSRFCIGK